MRAQPGATSVGYARILLFESASASQRLYQRAERPAREGGGAMSGAEIERFFSHPILNSPYAQPTRHWELDKTGQPTQHILESRRKADFISPIPKPKKTAKLQQSLELDPEKKRAESEQEYAKDRIDEIRGHVEVWRSQTNSLSMFA